MNIFVNKMPKNCLCMELTSELPRIRFESEECPKRQYQLLFQRLDLSPFQVQTVQHTL